jgi:hypothetical protein
VKAGGELGSAFSKIPEKGQFSHNTARPQNYRQAQITLIEGKSWQFS